MNICFEYLVLPKLSVGEAYRSRQLYFYVLGIVVHRGNESQSVEDIYIFLPGLNVRMAKT